MPILKVLHADVQETAGATPVQADMSAPELQQQQSRVQPSIPNGIAASQAASADIATDQLNPSFLDPQQLSPVVTPDQLLKRSGCDSQQACNLVIMQQPDSSLADQVQTSTSLVPADDHSPATARPAVFADLPSNGSDMLVNSPNERGVSSISKLPGAAQSKGSHATNAAAAATASEQQSPPAEPAAATASEQQSPPAEPAAAMASEQQSPPAEPAAAMASEQQSPLAEPAAATASEQQSPPAEPAAAMASEQQSPPAEPAAATASEQQSPPALPPGIVALADKLASSQGNLESAFLGPLATEVTLAAQRVITTQLSSASASAA